MKARVTVTLKTGVLDPQGKAIEGALKSLGIAGVESVRQGKVFDIELSGSDKAGAEEALRLGLVNRIVPAGEAVAGARRFAATIAQKSPLTVKIGKRAFYEQAEMPLAAAYDHATRHADAVPRL